MIILHEISVLIPHGNLLLLVLSTGLISGDIRELVAVYSKRSSASGSPDSDLGSSNAWRSVDAGG